MEGKLLKYASYVLYVTLIIGAAVLFLYNQEHRPVVLCLYGVFSAILVYLDISFSREKRKTSADKYLFAAALALALCIQFYDTGENLGFYFIILIVFVLIKSETRFCLPFTIVAIVLYLFTLFYLSGFVLADFWNNNKAYLLPRFFMIVVAIIARYIIRYSHENKRLAGLLQQKTAMLEDSVEELKETADLLAREKLMRELHDNLGHMLTTAFVGVQAAEVLMEKDAEASKKRLDIATQQIQQAMQALRGVLSGRSIGLEEEENASFTKKIIRFLTEAQNQANIEIRHNIREETPEELDALPVAARKLIYNALMEGLTNGLRHGAATAFRFSLTRNTDAVHFFLSDNGRGFESITFGYGLTKMRRDAQSIGGKFEISSNHGCTLTMMVPVS